MTPTRSECLSLENGRQRFDCRSNSEVNVCDSGLDSDVAIGLWILCFRRMPRLTVFGWTTKILDEGRVDCNGDTGNLDVSRG